MSVRWFVSLSFPSHSVICFHNLCSNNAALGKCTALYFTEEEGVEEKKVKDEFRKRRKKEVEVEEKERG